MKKLLLALPFLALIGAVVPSAHADQHHGFYRRHGYYRPHYHHHGYYRESSYGERHYRRVHGRRYYYYGDYRPGITLHIAP